MEVLEVAVQVCLVCLVIVTHIKDGAICLTAFYLDSAQITMFLCVRIVRQYINHS
jgi:hypothetical protein